MLVNITSAFPRRPVRILRTGIPSVLGLGFLALVMLAAGAGAAFWTAPDIVQDVQIHADPVEVPQGRITSGKCSTRLVLVSCDATLSYSVDARRYTKSVSILFLDIHFGNYTAGVVRSASQPQLATLDIGLDALWNRIGTAIAMVGFCVAIGIGLILRAMQTARLKRAAATPGPLLPVAVTVKQATKNWRGKNLSCAYEVNGRRGKFQERFRKNEEPFFLDRNMVLGVMPENGTTPLLVDEALSRLELSDAERYAIHAARQQGMAQPPQGYPAPAR
jgi:hypothetical protein